MQFAAKGKLSAERRAQRTMLHLLSAHDLQGAAAAAAASGYPRLAALIATAGQHPPATKLLTQQLDGGGLGNARAAWAASGMFSDRPNGCAPISRELEATYRLLAGQAGAALPLLAAPALTWQRALGLCLWYATPPEAPLADALRHYGALHAPADRAEGGNATTGSVSAAAASATASVSAGAAPPPLPAHALANAAAGTVDAQFALMRLCAAVSDNSAALAARSAAYLQVCKQLACTRSYTADALDALLPWLSLCLLRAVSVLPAQTALQQGKDVVQDIDMAGVEPITAAVVDDATSARCDDAFAAATVACADCLALLHEPLWAVYVLLHLPVASHSAAAAKADGVRAMLTRNWASIRDNGSGTAVQFLCEELQVPRAWLSAAAAPLERRDNDVHMLAIALLEAGQVAEGEAVLCEELAPELMNPAGVAALTQLVQQFADVLRTTRAQTLLVRCQANSPYHVQSTCLVRSCMLSPHATQVRPAAASHLAP